MSGSWREAEHAFPTLGPLGWLRVILRGGVLGGLILICLGLLLLIRLVERPVFGPSRPITPHITQFVCKCAFPILGLKLRVRGRPMTAPGALVANHSSWLDIFALNAAQRVYFVSKSEVANWPFIGWMARATGTVFIARKGTEAKVQQALFEARLRAGHRLAFFPEGTSTDCLRILPFKPTLFAAFYTHGMEQVVHLQPATVRYHAPAGKDARFYGWWGDMDFASHLKMVLASSRQGSVEVILHDPVAADAFADRKALAAHCEEIVKSAGPAQDAGHSA